jgi:hypothetical protein
MNKDGVMILVTMILLSTSALAFSPRDCGIEANVDNSAGLQQFCARIRGKLINDPGHGLIGKVEKATSIEGEPASEHYYLLGETYFDGNSFIGHKILKVCKVGHLCAVKAGVERNWEHNLDHATFWITKIIGEPIGE